MDTVLSTRRFPAEYIKQQPEFQFLKSGVHGEYSRVSIDVSVYARRPYSVNIVSSDSGVRSSSNTGTGSDGSKFNNSVHPRPSTTGAIKIVHKVNKKYASISTMPRPKTSLGFSSANGNQSKDNASSKSGKNRKVSGVTWKSNPLCVDTNDSNPEKKKSCYDPAFEKSKTFLHKRNDMFSKTNQYLTPARPGLRNLQLHYTGINTTYNDRVIFADLLQSAHKKNAIVGEEVYSLERRLYTKRADPSKCTTFWDRGDVVSPPARTRTARTVAQRKKERREKIQVKNEKIKFGYVPRANSLTIPSEEDMEELRYNCRYLRIDPRHQQHLYNTGLVFYSQDHAGPEIGSTLCDIKGGDETHVE
ncbi:uncharacterized protein LOC124260909 [Haliotis rubra]|uniref:uncharacterized protein LOC124260909 n=1 Tax=Haliotis rubra TaxID=36100 RepID=UPI001EE6183C|nr:uncharacterized protein LOC124260909 [Haliotis rubra]